MTAPTMTKAEWASARPVVVVSVPGRTGQISVHVKRYACAECGTRVDLAMDDPLPPSWRTALIVARWSVECVYYCGCDRASGGAQ